MSVERKVVLVTGAATGIGAAIARGFVAGGAVVIGADIAWDKADEDLPGVERIDCDASDPDSVQHCIADIEARFGAVEILVNNAALAGSVQPKPFEKISPEEWTRVMTVNTLMPFLCTQAVMPKMRERKWGRIINLTSGAIFQSVPNNLHYISSKGAIAIMTRSLAREIGRDGITVNAVAPGLTITKGIASNSAYSDEMRARIVAMRCIPREEEPDDVVGACLFLASDAAAFMTGQLVTVDGGTAFH